MRHFPEPCNPPFWARGGHAQTCWSHLLPTSAPRAKRMAGSSRREIELPDGDRLVAFSAPGTSGVRVHLFHGLSGDADSDYMRRAARAVRARGHGVWLVNHRSCGAGRGLARHPYHSGRSEDLEAVLAASTQVEGEPVAIVVGFSLSGNLALLHAAEKRRPQAAGIVAINPPVDLLRASRDIDRGFNRVYQRRFMRRLRQALEQRVRDGVTQRSYEIPGSMSLCEFDDVVTAPECGFANGLDYYSRCSSGPRLAEIDTPAVILTAADDPFVDPSVYDDLGRSEKVHLHLEGTGGHVGYLSRRGPWCTRWLDGAIAHYVDELARSSA